MQNSNQSVTCPSPPLFSSWKKFKPRIEELKNDSVITSINKRLSDNFISQSGAKSRIQCLEESFEGNQSFPKFRTNFPRRKDDNETILCITTPSRQNLSTYLDSKMDKIKLDGLFNGLRFTPYRKKGCFTPNSASPYSCSLFNPLSGINPNKAVFTIDSKTSSILIVNKNACSLLGYSSREFSELKFSNLLACKNKVQVSALAENQFNSEDGTMTMLSGKVVEMIHKNGDKIPVSLWIRHIDGHEGRCLAVAEPVERRVGKLIIDANGIVMSGDNEALMLFQLDSLDKFVGMDITILLPTINLPDSNASGQNIPKHIRKQRATGKTQDGVTFPLCLMITQHENDDDECGSNTSSNTSMIGGVSYCVTIWVYSNLSGLIVIDENSIIESCNHHFSTLMFGYSQSKIIGQNIFKLIPNFGQEFEYIDTRNQRSPSIENEESETETDHVLMHDPFSMSIAPTITSNCKPKDSFKICLDFTSTSYSTTSTCSDNCENDKNAANYVTNDDDTNELLTPVNEDQTTVEEINMSNSLTHIGTTTTKCNPLDLIVNETGTPPNIKKNSLIVVEQQKTPSGSTIMTTSTPDVRKRASIGLNIDCTKSQQPQQFNYNYVDGKYKGEAVHADGNIIDIVYTIYKHQLAPSNNIIYLIWISRDPDSERSVNADEEGDEEKQFNLTLTLNSLTSTIETSFGGQGGSALKNTTASSACLSNATSMMTSVATAGSNTLANITSQASRPNSLSIISQEEDQISGEYSKNYTTLKQIGKGAYGYVKMAYRNSDRLLVISKFILKEKLCPNFMITTEDEREIPMEIYLLMRIKHPNIVSVLDVYENEKFFQLIMEKHGYGMDLFEFIDRRPLMDEKLGCFIFRQIANAVDYLHSLNILHRDIKDENIIIDHHFHPKLIDFGSATFMQEGKLFSTFYGTTEYCSPEVLAGNKYQGPELEMWSLGVTLYVLMFFENPFLDMEDTLRAELLFPQDISVELENLLLRMLDKNPQTRMTMRELLSHEWITQEIVNNFNFASIVPCTESEANPEMYFTGQAYSSATALSTSHDSLSLVDDSIVDACDDDTKCDFDDRMTSIVKVTQNFTDLHLTNSNDDSGCRSSIANHRSKTENPSEKFEANVERLWESHYYSRNDAFEDTI